MRKVVLAGSLLKELPTSVSGYLNLKIGFKRVSGKYSKDVAQARFNTIKELPSEIIPPTLAKYLKVIDKVLGKPDHITVEAWVRSGLELYLHYFNYKLNLRFSFNPTKKDIYVRFDYRSKNGATVERCKGAELTSALPLSSFADELETALDVVNDETDYKKLVEDVEHELSMCGYEETGSDVFAGITKYKHRKSDYLLATLDSFGKVTITQLVPKVVLKNGDISKIDSVTKKYLK